MTEAKKPEDQNPATDATQVAANLPNDGVAEHAAPKKRGRPSNASKVLEAAQVPGDSAPKVEKPKPRAKKNEADAINLGNQLVGVHQMIAMVTGLPEIAIHEKEGEALAKGLLAISEEYGLALDGKTGASLQLFAAMAMIYAPRVYAVTRRFKAEKQIALQAQGAQVEGMAQMPANVAPLDASNPQEFASKSQ